MEIGDLVRLRCNPNRLGVVVSAPFGEYPYQMVEALWSHDLQSLTFFVDDLEVIG